jgi:hypothetical protein
MFRRILLVLLALAFAGCAGGAAGAVNTAGQITCIIAGTALNLASGTPAVSLDKCLQNPGAGVGTSSPGSTPESEGTAPTACGACLQTKCAAQATACIDDKEVCGCLIFCESGGNSEASCEGACSASADATADATLSCIMSACSASCPEFTP